MAILEDLDAHASGIFGPEMFGKFRFAADGIVMLYYASDGANNDQQSR
jgi:hypothetical protein